MRIERNHRRIMPSTSVAATLGVLVASTMTASSSASASSFAPGSHVYLAKTQSGAPSISRRSGPSILTIRGGDAGEGPSAPGAYNYGTQQPPGQMANPNYQYTPSASTGAYLDADMMGSPNNRHEYSETVEGRIDNWRRQQQQLQQSRTAAEAADVMDENGTFKLFTTVSRASVSVFFFILMWRTVHHYELADAALGRAGTFRGAMLRTTVVTPLVVLFLGEMMGAVLGLAGGRGIGGVSSANHATKKRLKGILNLHKGVELTMMVYNVARLAIFPSKYVPREVYIGRIIGNFFFLTQAHLYTKLSWDEVKAKGSESFVAESYYDDYTPDMASYEDEYMGVPGSEYTQWQPPATGNENYGEPLQSPQQRGYQSSDNASGWN